MHTAVDRHVGWPTWMQWWLASVAGIGLGIAVSMGIVLLVHNLVGGLAEDRVPTMLFLSAGIGLAQWFVLRRRLRGAGWWVPASIAGWTVGDLLARRLNLLMRSAAGMATDFGGGALVQALCTGTLLGVLQWLVLRRSLPRTGWWIVAAVAGPSILPLVMGGPLRNLAELLSFAVVAPSLTGLVLVWLLRHAVAGTPPLGGARLK
jgi:hypothetical protein